MQILDTPIEIHLLNGQTVYVKREDLFMSGGGLPYPALAKLRGAKLFIEKLKAQGVTKIGVFDTRISRAGQGVACVCKELELECFTAFPQLIGTELAEQHKIAGSVGAHLFPMKGGRTAVLYAQFKNKMEELGVYPMPLGLVCSETVKVTSKVAWETLEQLKFEGIDIKTIVLSTGTGTIATGVHLGSKEKGVVVIGISCGMSITEQLNRMRKMSYVVQDNLSYDFLKLISPEYEYYDKLDTSSCPFPTSPYYDMKAWDWLSRNIDKVEKPILFWNIGV
jgi:threonine dehydratase